MPQLLRSKLNPPIAGSSVIQRLRLDEWLYAALRSKLALIRAPAGSGKTTVMMQLLSRLEEQGRATAWLTLDDTDNDAGRFLTYLYHSLRKVDPSLAALAPGNAPFEGESLVLLDLLKWMTNFPTPFVIFLDDFEVIHNEEVLQMVRRVLDHLLPGQLVAIATREVRDLGVSRLRVRGQLLEIGPDDLRFRKEETERFLRKERGLPLDDDDLAQLQNCTEGWAAALQLVALAVGSREDGKALIESFSGSFYEIADYLAEDVLARQPEDVRSFLLRTSILERLSGPLCDAVTGQENSYQMLAYLERANLFLTPLDPQRRWYRYHKLFAEFLRGRLERTQPEILPQLHQKATDWLADQGMLVEAAQHAFAAGDLDRATELVAKCASSLVRLGQLRTVVDWAERLPSENLDLHPELRIAICWALAMRHRPREAQQILDQICRSTELNPVTDSAIRDDILALGMVILSETDNMDGWLKLAEEYLPRMHDRHSFAYGVLTNCSSCCLMEAGRFEDARRLIHSARHAHRKAGSVMGETYSDFLEGYLELLQGHLRIALGHLRSADSRMNRAIPGRSVPGAVAAVSLATVLYELDELEEAEQLLSQCIDLFSDCVPLDVMLLGYITLARIYANRGQEEDALWLLREAERIGKERGLARAAATVQLERIRFCLLQGKVEAAAKIAREANAEKVWQAFKGWIMFANDPETPQVSELRLMIRSGKARQALPRLKTELEQAEQLRAHRRALKLRVLTAEALADTGEMKSALRTMRSALLSASKEGYVRMFADEGAQVVGLIRSLAEASHVTEDNSDELELGYLNRIFTAQGQATALVQPQQPPSEDEPVEDLTPREIEILGLLARGFSNQALADRLFISITTVKFHLRNINSKLGAQNRMDAVAKAREQCLIT